MPTQNVETVAIVGEDINITDPTEITIKRSAGPQAGMGSTTALSDEPVESGEEAYIFVNGVRQVTGTIHHTEDRGDGAYQFTFYDATRALRQNTITKSYTDASVLDVIQDIFNATRDVAGVIDISPLTETDVDAGVSLEQPEYLITEEFTNTSCIRALDRVTRSVQWYWYVDHHNTIQVIDGFDYDHIDDSIPRLELGIGTQLPTGREFRIHDLQYVLDSSPGKRSPPYEKVVVTGASVGGGDSSQSHMMSTQPIQASATSDQYSIGDPVFHYQDEVLTTEANALMAAKKILQEFQNQQTGGWVETVGNPHVRPYDTITMPDHMSGAQYLISDVEHRLNSREGYVTRMSCSGLMSTGSDGATPSPYESNYAGPHTVQR